MAKFRFSITQNGVFWAIMLVAAMLRIYHISSYQYTHDELCACPVQRIDSNCIEVD